MINQQVIDNSFACLKLTSKKIKKISKHRLDQIKDGCLYYQSQNEDLLRAILKLKDSQEQAEMQELELQEYNNDSFMKDFNESFDDYQIPQQKGAVMMEVETQTQRLDVPKIMEGNYCKQELQIVREKILRIKNSLNKNKNFQEQIDQLKRMLQADHIQGLEKEKEINELKLNELTKEFENQQQVNIENSSYVDEIQVLDCQIKEKLGLNLQQKTQSTLIKSRENQLQNMLKELLYIQEYQNMQLLKKV